jgi:3-oxoacyl-[acyl-carrier-protein] synthase II
MKRVAVTGLGTFTPIGKTAGENWESLMKGRSGIRPITLFDASLFSSRIAGEISDYRGEDYFPTKELRRTDRFIQFALIAAAEALQSSGLDLAALNPVRTGTSVGVGLGGLMVIQSEHKEFLEKGPRRISPFFIPMVISNLAAGQISMKYGLKGPNTCITTACSSSAHSIGESFRLIQRGDVDVMFAGGAEATICELGIGGFCAMRALSQRNEDPTKASRPFDKDRDGFVMGEGAAILILEEWEHAKKRGAPVLAEMVGYALNADAFHLTQPAPEGEGAARCMSLALKDARLNADAVEYVNAHGTSTPIGDGLETTAIKTVFGEHAKKIAVSSTKSVTGHMLGAAGAVEAAYCVQALQHQVIPPTMNLENPSEDCDLDYVPNEPRPSVLNTVLSNSFGFGGTNASLVFSRPI